MATTVLFCDEFPFEDLLLHLKECKNYFTMLAVPFADEPDDPVDDAAYHRYGCKRYMSITLK